MAFRNRSITLLILSLFLTSPVFAAKGLDPQKKKVLQNLIESKNPLVNESAKKLAVRIIEMDQRKSNLEVEGVASANTLWVQERYISSAFLKLQNLSNLLKQKDPSLEQSYLALKEIKQYLPPSSEEKAEKENPPIPQNSLNPKSLPMDLFKKAIECIDKRSIHLGLAAASKYCNTVVEASRPVSKLDRLEWETLTSYKPKELRGRKFWPTKFNLNFLTKKELEAFLSDPRIQAQAEALRFQTGFDLDTVDAATWELLSKFTKLKALKIIPHYDLFPHSLSDSGMTNLTGVFSRLSTLHSFEILDSDLTMKKLQILLPALKKLPALKALKLIPPPPAYSNENKLSRSAAMDLVGQGLGALSELESLELFRIELDPETLPGIGPHLEKLKHLKTLKLEEYSFTGVPLRDLTRYLTKMPELKELGLKNLDLKLNEDSLPDPTNRSESSQSDLLEKKKELLEALASGITLLPQSLTHLDLSNCNLEPKYLSELIEAFRKLPNLASLTVSASMNPVPADTQSLKAFQKALPQIKVMILP